MMTQRAHVPLLSMSGKWLGLRPVEAIQRLEAAGQVECTHARGIIAYATLTADTPAPCGPASPDAFRSRDSLRYTYRERLTDSHRVYDLKRLDGARGGLNYAPAAVRPLFSAVVRSCLK